MKLAMAQTRQDRFHIAGKGCRKGHDLSRPGMTERQCLRMKGLSVNGKTGLLRLIFGISHQGMSQISHMDADLMRPSSLEAAAHDRKAAVTFKNLIIGHGKAAAGRHNSHTHAVLGVSVDEGLNMAPVVLDIAPHNSKLSTLVILVLDLLGMRQMSSIVFCTDHDAASILIEAMHNAGPDNAVDS